MKAQTAERTVAHAIVDQLAAWGVKSIFGVPGSSLLPLLAALADQSAIRLYAVRHEEGAALMASAQAKLTGRLGVCLAHAGPGAAHLVNGLYDAHQDGVPVLALSGQVPLGRLGTDYKQSVDQSLMFTGCAGLTRQVDSPESALDLLLAGLRYATSMGDVAHLALPSDVQAQPCDPGEPKPAEPYLTAAPQVDPAALDDASALLSRSQRPAVLMGRGASAAAAEVLQLAERLGAPVITSLFAKGLAPEDHPLVVGVLGEAGTDAAAQVAKEADALLVLGCTWWPKQQLGDDLAVVQVDLRPTAIGGGNPVQVGIVARCEQAVPALASRLTGDRRPWFHKPEADAPPRGDAPFHPAQLLAALRAAVPENAIVSVDTGLTTLWYGRAFPARRETTLISGRWRTMGFGLPAAIAARLTEPRRASVALCGDGGFTMSLPELCTAVKYELPVVALVFSNGLLGEEAAKQRRAGFEPFGMELANPDFAALARACGAEGRRVASPGELEPTLREAFEAGRPFVVDLPTAYVAVPAIAATRA